MGVELFGSVPATGWLYELQGELFVDTLFGWSRTFLKMGNQQTFLRILQP